MVASMNKRETFNTIQEVLLNELLKEERLSKLRKALQRRTFLKGAAVKIIYANDISKKNIIQGEVLAIEDGSVVLSGNRKIPIRAIYMVSS